MTRENTKSIASIKEQQLRAEFKELFKNCPISDDELIPNLGIFEKRQEFTKKLFFYEMYKQILDVHGIIMEFGTRWGQNLITLNNLRGILEPYNYSRKIIGFDTFAGFKGVHKNDGNHEIIRDGAFDVVEKYDEYLQDILEYHETEAPLSHIKKNFIIKGNASIELAKYLKNHPETIIALAYFDFDIYEPTKNCLLLIKDYITKGTIIGFDELLDPYFPGETIAYKEILGLKNFSLKRINFCGIQSFLIIE